MANLNSLLHVVIEIVFIYLGLFTDAEVFVSLPRKPNIVDLNKGWLGSSLNESKIYFTADVPFTIHNALLKKGILKDPYFRYNDRAYRWVSMHHWLVKKEFDASSGLFKFKKINLVLNGIDTIGYVYLNDVEIGTSYNKFVPSHFDVTKALKPGQNTISIRLVSPIQFALIKSEEYKIKYNYSILPNCYPEVLHGECHSNFIRKEPCSFGWDFGPSFPTQGVSNSVFLECFSGTSIVNVLVQTERRAVKSGWVLLASATLDCPSEVNETLYVRFAVLETSLQKTEKVVIQAGSNKIYCKIIAEGVQIKPWWPRGYGEQNLYSIRATLLNSRLLELQSKSIKFGFRTVELIEEPIKESPGLSFFFKINSLPIFLKGSNWIPADALRDRVTNDVINNYLQSAVDANMNVLRVWGGGGYEVDYFYEACDRLGLMIWHDLMFACAMYPTNTAFLSSVSLEIEYQVQRLHRHPSIVVWSANNENEVALRENWYGTQSKFNQYKRDYIKLYVDTLKSLVSKIDVTRPFIVSSPSNGIDSQKEGWIAQEPRSPFYGDVHVYDYLRNCWDVDIFPKPRFASEYGYQSYPSIESLMNVSLHEDLQWNSTLMFYRQHHQSGNRQIENMIKMNFKLPFHNDSFVYFERMIYMSQIVQALCIEFESEHYRRLQGRLEVSNLSRGSPEASNPSQGSLEAPNPSQGSLEAPNPSQGSLEAPNPSQGSLEASNLLRGSPEAPNPSLSLLDQRAVDTYESKNNVGLLLQGHTMGAMYWQLNDIWPAPSWASLEYGGKWKMLQYYAKNFFSPLAASAYIKKNQIEVFIVSDLQQVTKNVMLNVTTYNWSSFNSLQMTSFVQDIQAQSSTKITSLNMKEICEEPSNCFLILSVVVPFRPDLQCFRPVYLTPFLQVKGLGDPKLVIEGKMKKIGDAVVEFIIRGSRPAAFVWLSTSCQGKFSDNGFLLYQESRSLNFTAATNLDIQKFSKKLKVLSLYDMYT